MPALMASASSSIVVISSAANGGRNGWCGTEATVGADAFAATFLVDDDDHPDTHSTSMAQERGAVDPTRTSLALAILVRACKPANLCSDTTALTKRCS